MAKYLVETDGGKYEIQTEDGAESAAANFEFERGSNYPNSKMTDVSVTDYLTAEGVGGLAKLGAKGIAAGIGKALPKNAVETVGEMANNQLIKSTGGRIPVGATADQVKDIQEAASAGRKAGLDDVFTTNIGRRESLEALKSQTGKEIGALRQEAGPASPGFLDDIAKNDPKIAEYSKFDTKAGELPLVTKSLNDASIIAGEAPTNAKLAEAATFLNKGAATNKPYQAVNGMTDVANSISAKNNAEIAHSLGSEKSLDYLNKLKDETGLFKLEKLMGKGEIKDINSKDGVLMGLINAIKKTGGHRASSKMLNELYEALTGTTGGVGQNVGQASKITPVMLDWLNKQDRR